MALAQALERRRAPGRGRRSGRRRRARSGARRRPRTPRPRAACGAFDSAAGSAARTAGSRARGAPPARRRRRRRSRAPRRPAGCSARGCKRLHDHAARAARRARRGPATCVSSWNVRSAARKSGKLSDGIGEDARRPASRPGTSWPLVIICVPIRMSKPPALPGARAALPGCPCAASCRDPCARRARRGKRSRSSASSCSVPAPHALSAGSPQLGAAPAAAAWCSRSSGSAARASGDGQVSVTLQLRAHQRLAAGAALQEVGEAAPVEKHETLAAGGEVGLQRRASARRSADRRRAAALRAQIDDLAPAAAAAPRRARGSSSRR